MDTDSTVRVQVTILAETPRAFRVAERGVGRPAVVWVPSAQISFHPEHACVGDSVEMTIPEWLAVKSGFHLERS